MRGSESNTYHITYYIIYYITKYYITYYIICRTLPYCATHEDGFGDVGNELVEDEHGDDDGML